LTSRRNSVNCTGARGTRKNSITRCLRQKKGTHSGETVGENLHAWYGHVKKSKSPGMKTFMRTIKEREGDLLNYYETFVTNASVESLNSGIKGFRTELHGISNLPFFFYRVCKIYG
jgi:transposase